MKKSLIAFTLLIFAFTNSSIAQNTQSKKAIPIPVQSNTERYGIDYELKDYVFINGDSSILNLLNLEPLEPLRSETQNTEVIDTLNGVTIILFYEKKEINRNTYLYEKL
tara:strand:+ start:4104 stop:4430 length:327 start_codon:yes stop_codon:yes gene_type:complete